MEVDTLIEAASQIEATSLIEAAPWFMAAYWGLLRLRNGGWVTYCLHHNLSLHHILRLLQLNVSHLHSYMTTSLLIILNLWQHACSIPKYLRISRKHAYAEFFQQGTPHYLREVPHNSAKGIKIIGTSANKGEDELKTMADLASQRVVLLGPKHNQGVSVVSDLWITMKPVNQANHFIIFQSTPHLLRIGMNSHTAFTPQNRYSPCGN